MEIALEPAPLDVARGDDPRPGRGELLEPGVELALRRWTSASCALRSVMSVYATMLPTTRPDASLTGAAAIETGTSAPSLRRRTVS